MVVDSLATSLAQPGCGNTVEMKSIKGIFSLFDHNWGRYGNFSLTTLTKTEKRIESATLSEVLFLN